MACSAEIKIPSLFYIFKRFQSVNIKEAPLNDTIKNILSNRSIGSAKNIKGWAKSMRKMKDLIFIDVQDGSTANHLQVVIPKTCSSQSLTYGSSVEVTGTLQTTPKGQLELFADNVLVLGTCDVSDNYPFTPKQKLAPDYCRQYLHFRPRTSNFASLLRVRHIATKGVHDFFHKSGFLNVHTPLITGNDCEGAGEVFKVEPANPGLLKEMTKEGHEGLGFFNEQAYLTVSGQLQLEAVARSFTKVYTFNPTFRAENSKSRLHLSEFYMIDVEESFVTSLEPILNTMEALVKSLIQLILSDCCEDMEVILKYNEVDSKKHFEYLENVVKNPFTVISLQDALKTVGTAVEDGLTKEQELLLVDKNKGMPVFIVDWPRRMKPFYMKPKDDDSSMVSAVDLLVPNVGELCGGSLREDNYNRLHENLVKNNLLKSLQWYLDLRKYGNTPTGGFGMGFERFLQFVLQTGNIKDVIPFPRWPHNLQM